MDHYDRLINYVNNNGGYINPLINKCHDDNDRCDIYINSKIDKNELLFSIPQKNISKCDKEPLSEIDFFIDEIKTGICIYLNMFNFEVE